MRLPITRPALVSSTIFIILLGSGCQSGMSGSGSLWKRPDFSKMAFWKKEESSVPKPPAVHFDPTPAQPEHRMADQSTTGSNASGLKNSIDKLAGYEDKTKTNPVDELADMAANLNHPIRAPYQVSEQNSKGSMDLAGSPAAYSAQSSTNDNDFLFKPSQANSAGMTTPHSDSVVEDARAKFAADMRGLQPTPSAPLAFTQPANSTEFPVNQTANNEPAQAINGLTVSPSSNISNSEQRRLESEIEKAQREIAELKAQLASNSQNRLVPIGSAQTNSNSSFAGDKSSSPSAEIMENRYASANPDNAAFIAKPGLSPSTPNSAFAPLKPNPPFETPPEKPANSYPATSHSQFSAAPFDEMRIAREFVDPTVRPAGLQAPPSMGGIGQTNKSQSGNSTDIDIPDSILKGKGTYAPGSVNRLRN
jgi:hypothetical protein